jgi:hypothetical protein
MTASVRGGVGLSLRGDAKSSSCAPAARLGDKVAGSAPGDAPFFGSILGGAPSVCMR